MITKIKILSLVLFCVLIGGAGCKAATKTNEVSVVMLNQQPTIEDIMAGATEESLQKITYKNNTLFVAWATWQTQDDGRGINKNAKAVFAPFQLQRPVTMIDGTKMWVHDGKGYVTLGTNDTFELEDNQSLQVPERTIVTEK